MIDPTIYYRSLAAEVAEAIVWKNSVKRFLNFSKIFRMEYIFSNVIRCQTATLQEEGFHHKCFPVTFSDHSPKYLRTGAFEDLFL